MSCFSVPQQLNRNTTIERQQFFVRQEKDKKGKKRNIKISNTPNWDMKMVRKKTSESALEYMDILSSQDQPHGASNLIGL